MAYATKGRDVPDDLLHSLRQMDFGTRSVHDKMGNAVVKELIDPVIRSLQSRDLIVRPEFVGSSFEGTKTGGSDFDILLILDGSGLEPEQMTPQFSALRPCTHDNPTFKGLLTCQRRFVDPRKARRRLRSCIQRALNQQSSVGAQGKFNVRMGESGPAITLVIEPKSSSQNRYGETISVDLVPTFEVSDLYFVTKPCKQEMVRQPGTVVPRKRLLWRKSFSLREKQVLKKIDRDGGCRRECVKILKCLKKRDSPLKYLASYHYKVLVLRECSKYRRKKDWTADRLADRLWGCLESLEEYLKRGELPHVFDESINTFDTVSDPTALKNTERRIRKILNKGSDGIASMLGKYYGI